MKVSNFIKIILYSTLLLSLASCNESSGKKSDKFAKKEVIEDTIPDDKPADHNSKQEEGNSEPPGFCSGEIKKDFTTFVNTALSTTKYRNNPNSPQLRKVVVSLKKQCSQILSKYDESKFGCMLNINGRLDSADYDSFVENCKGLDQVIKAIDNGTNSFGDESEEQPSLPDTTDTVVVTEENRRCNWMLGDDVKSFYFFYESYKKALSERQDEHSIRIYQRFASRQCQNIIEKYAVQDFGCDVDLGKSVIPVKYSTMVQLCDEVYYTALK
jgi:hypothetical protein